MKTAEVIDMSAARVNVEHMSKMIQIRNVPDDLHRELKVRAAVAGMSMSDYIKRELSRRGRKSTIKEIYARSQGRSAGSTLTTQDVVDTIREMRGD
jgi:antitoxin FitA